jgi:invasion associated locus B (IalB) protein
MTIRGHTRLGLLAALVLLSAPPGRAETVKKHAAAKHPAATVPAQRIGGAGPWSAYLYQAKSGRVCYLAGAPQKSEPARFRRKPPSVTVTHRPEENVFNVVNFYEGYPLKQGSEASLDIDGTNFDLFTKDDGAWSRTADTDKAIVEAMAKGRKAVIKGVSEKGPATTDSYSLAGFTQTLALIDKACGAKR